MSQPPPGQGPIDPQGAFSPPPAPGGSTSMPPPGYFGPPIAPPPGMYPPPFMMQPPPPRRGFFTRWVLRTLATVVFAGALLISFVVIVGVMGLAVGKGMQEQDVIEKGDLTNRIAVLTVDGVITEKTADKFHKSLKSIMDDTTVKAVVVEIDSPGGTITASDEIYHDLMLFKTRPGKTMPVVVAQKSLAASGGYYISCAADYIVAEPSTMTGNIGVLFERFNVSKMFEKWGVEETTLKSKSSPFKNAESMFKPESPEANAYLQTLIDEAYDQFAGVVKAGRSSASNALKGPLPDIANGKIYTANQAYKLGLVDQIDYPEAAYAVAAKRAGLTGSPTVFRVKEVPTVMELLTSRTGLNPASAVSNSDNTTIDFHGAKIDASAVYELLAPRMLYLWNGG